MLLYMTCVLIPAPGEPSAKSRPKNLHLHLNAVFTGLWIHSYCIQTIARQRFGPHTPKKDENLLVNPAPTRTPKPLSLFRRLPPHRSPQSLIRDTPCIKKDVQRRIRDRANLGTEYGLVFALLAQIYVYAVDGNIAFVEGEASLFSAAGSV
jgi:hypothetical protein